ncbi:uncharacterized protein LOC126695723 [Quercus robur]|uniref:uncharacterized protein LOC126695723 n=1 Tax=Quercus robur TaxID=38942 RepID=UPI002162508A|nr:uncharacterized protein LOC126695723 [Quercus robur]
MEGFRRVVNVCGFIDLGYEGPEFTWCNQRSTGERIRLRLDRLLATTDWKDHYKDTRVLHVVDSTSDHCALVLTNQRNIQGRGKRRFHFEATWVRHDKCKEIIQDAWKFHLGFQTASDFAEGLRVCAEGLTRWNNSDLRHDARMIKEKRKQLQVLIQADRDGSRGEEINAIRKEINEMLDDEEVKWNQRSILYFIPN